MDFKDKMLIPKFLQMKLEQSGPIGKVIWVGHEVK